MLYQAAACRNDIFDRIKACLGAVIILAAISMFDVDGIKHTWKLSTKVTFFGIEKAQFALDCIPMLLCFIFCFWDIGRVLTVKISVPTALRGKGLFKLTKSFNLVSPSGQNV